MFYAIVTAVNNNVWETQHNHIQGEVIDTIDYIAFNGRFTDKSGFSVYVNPKHILSIEITEE